MGCVELTAPLFIPPQGTDVIECYATYGHDARIKVSHCNKRYGRH
jgi:hypothetical protein